MATEVQVQQTQQAPPVLPEVTWQALVCAFFVSAIVAGCYPYIVLKLGIGPNVSVVSAFLGAVMLLAISRQTRGRNRLMNNIIQTAGTSAAQTAFMCVIAAAVDLVHLNPVVQSQLNGLTGIAPWPMFFWLTCAGGIGVLFTVFFRRHFLSDPKMVFADGIAAAETIIVLDSPGRESRDKLWTLGLCSLASAVVNFFHDGAELVLHMIKNGPKWATEALTRAGDWFGTLWPYAGAQGYLVGFGWSFLTIGTGMLVGVNVGLSMIAGTAAVGCFGPQLIKSGIGRDIVLSEISPQYRDEVGRIMQSAPSWKELSPADQTFLQAHGSSRAVAYMKHSYFNTVLLWFMWPATALMITSAVTAVMLQWRAIGRSFMQLRAQSQQRSGEDVSLSNIVIVSLLLTAGLAFVQNYNFGMSYLQTVVAVLCSLPLILVGIIVLGETNFGPISV
ncbi:MAG TPA: OPT/YSL family transporter, partial [Gemmataceae bacterium]|nr:OPT/YSL family transporter [Gemmataceae bacterium]